MSIIVRVTILMESMGTPGEILCMPGGGGV